MTHHSHHHKPKQIKHPVLVGLGLAIVLTILHLFTNNTQEFAVTGGAAVLAGLVTRIAEVL